MKHFTNALILLAASAIVGIQVAAISRAKELAAQMEADAGAQEITLDDIEPKFGSLATIIYEAMHQRFDG